MAGFMGSGLSPSQFDFAHLFLSYMHCKLTPIYSCSLLLAKVRRLYDIANVLTSLGLIKKVHVTEERGRKPAFKWIGPVEFPKNTGNLGTLHLFSFCFDSPFPSGKRLVSTCKE